LRAKALESVSDITLVVFSSAFGHFRFNRCALCGVRGQNAAKQRRPLTGPGVREPRAVDHLLVSGRQMHVMSYLREYLFRDEQARQPVRTLSGGIVRLRRHRLAGEP
jgi:hypothetical protein